MYAVLPRQLKTADTLRDLLHSGPSNLRPGDRCERGYWIAAYTPKSRDCVARSHTGTAGMVVLRVARER